LTCLKSLKDSLQIIIHLNLHPNLIIRSSITRKPASITTVPQPSGNWKL
jgi:hypothetical protein